MITRNADEPRTLNGINHITTLTEKGEKVNGGADSPSMHDILTGSTPDGRVAVSDKDTTCGNWSRSGEGVALPLQPVLPEPGEQLHDPYAERTASPFLQRDLLGVRDVALEGGAHAVAELLSQYDGIHLVVMQETAPVEIGRTHG